MKLIDQGDLAWCRRVARGVCREMGLMPDRAFDDVLGAGHVGLMIAAKRFDSARAAETGITFRQYAAMDVRKRCVGEAMKIIRCGVVGDSAPLVHSEKGLDEDGSFRPWEDREDGKDHFSKINTPLAGAAAMDGYDVTRTSDLRN